MDVKPGVRVVAKITLVLLFTFVFVIISYILLPDLVWSRPNTNISIHALLGLLAVMTGAIAFLRSRSDPRISNTLLYSAFLFLGLLHLVDALLHQLGLIAPGSNLESYRLVANLFEITLFFSLLSAALILKIKVDVSNDQTISFRYGIIIPSAALINYWLIYFLVLPFLSLFILAIFAFLLVILTNGIIFFTIWSIVNSNKTWQHYNFFWTVIGLILYAFASPIL
ncbi:MAG: hypothetical protein ACFFD8_09415, partial [Candidatus Thorarchaeota archaeon]